jgi:hypothetical protein
MIYNMNTGVHISTENNSMRDLIDRRQCPTPLMSRYTLYGGRRKTVRRGEDKKDHIYVDLYSTRLLIVVMSLLLLSCLDAFLTLELIREGNAVEANPLMAYVLKYGITPFTTIKFTITSCALIILCVFKNVKITRICLPLALKMYLLVVIYECYLYLI